MNIIERFKLLYMAGLGLMVSEEPDQHQAVHIHLQHHDRRHRGPREENDRGHWLTVDPESRNLVLLLDDDVVDKVKLQGQPREVCQHAERKPQHIQSKPAGEQHRDLVALEPLQPHPNAGSVVRAVGVSYACVNHLSRAVDVAVPPVPDVHVSAHRQNHQHQVVEQEEPGVELVLLGAFGLPIGIKSLRQLEICDQSIGNAAPLGPVMITQHNISKDRPARQPPCAPICPPVNKERLGC
eukprot:scaffold333138_cov33-Prasinocladus_malaysianus.AAC.1